MSLRIAPLVLAALGVAASAAGDASVLVMKDPHAVIERERQAARLDTPERWDAVWRLARLGPDGRRVLLAALSDPDPLTAQAAAWALGDGAPPAGICEVLARLRVTAKRRLTPALAHDVFAALETLPQRSPRHAAAALGCGDRAAKALAEHSLAALLAETENTEELRAVFDGLAAHAHPGAQQAVRLLLVRPSEALPPHPFRDDLSLRALLAERRADNTGAILTLLLARRSGNATCRAKAQRELRLREDALAAREDAGRLVAALLAAP